MKGQTCLSFELGNRAALQLWRAGFALRNKAGNDKIDLVTAIPLVNNFCVEFPSSSKSQRIFEFISSSDLILFTRQWEKFCVYCVSYLRSDLPGC